MHSRTAMEFIHDLNFGAKFDGREIVDFNRGILFEKTCNVANSKIDCEAARTDKIGLDDMEFIKHAHDREQFLR